MSFKEDFNALIIYSIKLLKGVKIEERNFFVAYNNFRKNMCQIVDNYIKIKFNVSAVQQKIRVI